MKKALLFIFAILFATCICLLSACRPGESFMGSRAPNTAADTPASSSTAPATPAPSKLPAPSTDIQAVQLQALSITHTQLNPKFTPDTYAYNAAVTYDRAEVKIDFQPAVAQTVTQVTFNGKELESKTILLDYGDNDIRIDIQNGQGQSQTYSVVLHRETPADPGKMSPLEKQFVETALRLLPERNPFVLAYEEAYGVNIDSYSKTVNGKRVSGVPFRYGGNGDITGYDDNWWTASGDSKYPANGMDCAEYMHWIYYNMGYKIPGDSSSIFFAGIAGVRRYTPGIGKTHWVIPTLSATKIGDIVYNSEESTYVSGKGSHVGMFLGTARKLGITKTLAKYFPGFPMDAYLYIDTGWADESFYLHELHSIGIKGNRIFGTGVQYFPSVKGNDGKYIYKSPYRNEKTRILRWKDSVSGMTFEVTSAMEQEGRPFQHRPDMAENVRYLLNISRPIIRND